MTKCYAVEQEQSKFEPVGDSYVLVLDATFDVRQTDATAAQIHIDAYETGYRRAAERLAVQLNYLDIAIIRGSYTGPQMQEQTRHGDEGELWQLIHNHTQPAAIRIDIAVEGVWATRGRLTRENEIVEVPANLGGDVHTVLEGIEQAIASGEDVYELHGVSYTWDLYVI